jgi:hypothetical protein
MREGDRDRKILSWQQLESYLRSFAAVALKKVWWPVATSTPFSTFALSI